MNNEETKQIILKYKDKFNLLNAHIYTFTPNEEILLLRWWMHLTESTDITRLIKPSSRSVSEFYNLFKYPNTLIYTLDDSGEIDNAGWVEPTEEKATIRTASNGLWTRSDNRGKKRQYQFTNLYYNLAFEFFDAILGLTWQEDLLALHTKLGYNIVGCIPDYYGQPYCYIMHLKKEDFINSQFSKVNQRRR